MVLDVSKGKVSLREAPEAARDRRCRARLRDDDPGRKAAQALRPAGHRCCTYVYLYAMSASRFLPADGSEVRASWPSGIGAIPDRARHDSPDFALVRPRARHARSAGEACAGSRGDAAALDFRRRLARRTGKDRAAARPLLRARQNEIAHNLCTAIIDPQGKLARLEVGTSRNKWENVDLLKTIYSLIPPAAEPAKP